MFFHVENAHNISAKSGNSHRCAAPPPAYLFVSSLPSLASATISSARRGNESPGHPGLIEFGIYNVPLNANASEARQSNFRNDNSGPMCIKVGSRSWKGADARSGLSGIGMPILFATKAFRLGC